MSIPREAYRALESIVGPEYISDAGNQDPRGTNGDSGYPARVAKQRRADAPTRRNVALE